MLWWITLSSIRLIQQYSTRSKEVTWHAISRLSKVDKTGINVVGKHNHMELKPSSLMHAPNICCEAFYVVIIQVSEETSRISTCAKNPIGCVLTYFVMVLFLQQSCHFAETLLYHFAFSALLHTISRFLKNLTGSCICCVSAQSDLELTLGWFLPRRWRLEALCGPQCWNPIGATY